MKINTFDKLIGSGFLTGYIPTASGTFGSLAGLAIYFIPGFEKLYILIPAIIVFTLYGIYVGSKFETLYGKDPAECTIDEVVGMWITLVLIPKTVIAAVIAFLIWRIMDIIKPAPARQAEKLHGGLGIMMDDVIAGIYSLVLVHLILFIFVRLNISLG